VRLTPLEIQKHSFPTRLRGLDRAEVEGFLRLVAEDYESAVRECEGLRERVLELSERVAELAQNEKRLQETLVTAQTMSEDLCRTAARESEVRIAEAEVKAEKIVDAAHRRAARLAEDIREMRGLRKRLGTALRTTIQTHLSLLERLYEEPAELEASGRTGAIDLPSSRRAAGGERGA